MIEDKNYEIKLAKKVRKISTNNWDSNFAYSIEKIMRNNFHMSLRQMTTWNRIKRKYFESPINQYAMT